MRTTDLILRDDIRFLGRLLGDTLRENKRARRPTPWSKRFAN